MNQHTLRRAGFVFYVLAAVVIYLANLFTSLNFLVQDALCQYPTRPQPDIFVIGVDDKTLDALGPWNNWPRSTMAKLLRTLNADPARRPAAIGLDVMCFGQTQSGEDAALAEAVRDSGNVVLASQLLYPQGIWQERTSDGLGGLAPQVFHRAVNHIDFIPYIGNKHPGRPLAAPGHFNDTSLARNREKRNPPLARARHSWSSEDSLSCASDRMSRLPRGVANASRSALATM